MIALRPAEIRVFQRRERLSVSQWAEKYRVVKKSSFPGPWRNKITPYLRGVMDTFGEPGVREIVLCKGVQTGGTEAAYNCLAFEMDRSSDNALVVMADEKSVKKLAKGRIIPMLFDSPRLSTLISDNPDDTTIYGVRLNTGFSLNIGWATSQVALASDPCRVVVLDEVDKYTSGLNLAEAKARTTTYPHTKKIFTLSTPGLENGPVWTELQGCDELRDYWVPCPDCGAIQVMEFSQFKWPQQAGLLQGLESADAKAIRRNRMAWYECRECGSRWDDTKRDTAVQHGEWQPRTPIKNAQGIGFHLPSWYSRFVSLSEVVARWLEAQDDDQKLRAWFNNVAALPYVPERKERKETHILTLRDDRPRGLVPKGISCLTIAIDTQMRGFYYEVRAWGYGLELESWQVREGFVETFSALEQIIYRDEHRDAGGAAYHIQYGIIDSGGGMGDFGVSRTTEVYNWCRLHRHIFPIKGQQRMSKLWKCEALDNYPGTNKPIVGGLNLYHINVTSLKNDLERKLKIAPSDPGAWHLHTECSDDYARQMCSEYKDERGFWQCPRGKANHFWDVSVYQLALAEIVQIKFWPKPADGQQGVQPSGRRVRSTGIQ